MLENFKYNLRKTALLCHRNNSFNTLANKLFSKGGSLENYQNLISLMPKNIIEIFNPNIFLFLTLILYKIIEMNKNRILNELFINTV